MEPDQTEVKVDGESAMKPLEVIITLVTTIDELPDLRRYRIIDIISK